MTNKKQLKEVKTQLQTVGKASTQLEKKKQEVRLMQEKQLSGLVKNSKEIIRGLSAQDAFEDGLLLHTANAIDGTNCKLLLLGELERLVRAVNATRSFQTQEDLQDAVDDVIELFPTLKVEEILLCFKQIRQGKFELFGNLTTNTLIKCLHKYEADNTTILRERKYDYKDKPLLPYHTGMINWKALGDAIIVEQTQKSLEELGGHTHLTESDFEEIKKAQEKYKTQNAD